MSDAMPFKKIQYRTFAKMFTITPNPIVPQLGVNEASTNDASQSSKSSE